MPHPVVGIGTDHFLSQVVVVVTLGVRSAVDAINDDGIHPSPIPDTNLKMRQDFDYF